MCKKYYKLSGSVFKKAACRKKYWIFPYRKELSLADAMKLISETLGEDKFDWFSVQTVSSRYNMTAYTGD
jgi:hypothetical protein